MKTFSRSLFASLFAAGLLAAPVLTHAEPHSAAGQRGGYHHAHGSKAYGADKAFKGIDLSEAQRDQLFEIRHQQAPTLRDLGKKVGAARKEFREATQGEQFDESKAKAASDKLGSAMAELQLEKARGYAKMQAVLTDAQRKTLAERKKDRADKREAKKDKKDKKD